jgi:hypothetical protein
VLNVPSGGASLAEDVYGPFSGQVTSAVRQAMRRAVLEANPRLVEAMFLCEMSSTAESLSGVRAPPVLPTDLYISSPLSRAPMRSVLPFGRSSFLLDGRTLISEQWQALESHDGA